MQLSYRCLCPRMLPFHGHSLHPRGLIFGMGGPQGIEMVFHYSDIRISGFGFFRILALFSHIINPILLRFSVWGSQALPLKFYYPYLRISDFGFFGLFRILAIFSHIIDPWCVGSLGWLPFEWSSTIRIFEYPISDFFRNLTLFSKILTLCFWFCHATSVPKLQKIRIS